MNLGGTFDKLVKTMQESFGQVCENYARKLWFKLFTDAFS